LKGWERAGTHDFDQIEGLSYENLTERKGFSRERSVLELAAGESELRREGRRRRREEERTWAIPPTVPDVKSTAV